MLLARRPDLILCGPRFLRVIVLRVLVLLVVGQALFSRRDLHPCELLALACHLFVDQGLFALWLLYRLLFSARLFDSVAFSIARSLL